MKRCDLDIFKLYIVNTFQPAGIPQLTICTMFIYSIYWSWCLVAVHLPLTIFLWIGSFLKLSDNKDFRMSKFRLLIHRVECRPPLIINSNLFELGVLQMLRIVVKITHYSLFFIIKSNAILNFVTLNIQIQIMWK